MKNYQVGYARVDITPKESVPLAGFGRTSFRMSRCVRDPLYASCFAITDENDQTVILMSVDLQRGGKRETDVLRAAAEKCYGIPGDHVMFSGTHTHAGPDTFNDDEPSIQRYYKLLDEKLPLCMGLALADRREAKMSVGEVEAYRMNFVKHYCHTTPEGEVKYFGDNFGTQVLDETTCHATQADPTVHIVKFEREGCKDLVLINFRAHGLMCSSSKKYDVSADLMGGIRTAFEQKSDALITYFQGAAGNMNPKSRIGRENITLDCVAYGNIFADYVLEGLKNMRPVEAAPIKTKQLVLNSKTNRPAEEDLVYARAVAAKWVESGDYKLSVAEGAPIGIRSPYQANAMLNRAKLPDTCPIELNAITLGDLAIVTAPNELFDTLSVYVEDHAPYGKVLTFGYSNDMQGYIPSKFGFEYTCYESDCCKFLPGIGETIRDTFLELLNDLKN